MESVSIMPASLADRIPLPDEALTARMLAKAREGFDRKIVVLDDDPTGVQTVHDLPVYTDFPRSPGGHAPSPAGLYGLAP